MARWRSTWLVFYLAATATLAYGLWRYVLVPGRVEWRYGDTEFKLAEPLWLAVVVVVPLLFFVASRSLADLPRLQRWLSSSLRALVLTALALALSQPVIVALRHQVSAVLVVDVSESMTDRALERAAEFVEQVRQVQGDNLLRLVTFAQRPRRIRLDDAPPWVPPRGSPPAAAPPAAPPPAAALPAGDAGPGVDEATAERPGPGAATDIQAALQLGYGLLEPGTIKRIVIVSDGNETQGNLLAEAQRAQEDVTIHHRTFPELRQREALVAEVILPDRIRVGEPFEVTVEVWASHQMNARLTLYQGNVINGLGGIQPVELEPGRNRYGFRSVVHLAGPIVYRAELSELEADRFADNNRYALAAEATGRPTVLYVEGERSAAQYLQRALSQAELDVEVRTGRAFPTSLQEMERFDAIILSDVPAEALSQGQMQTLERYVRDVGGGFIMAGGPNSFGMGGYYGTTIERLLPVRLDTDRRREQPVLALVLVIDKSGSMSGTPIELAKEAARATAGMLAPDDLIEVVAFDSRPSTIVRMTPARNRSKISDDIRRLTAGGGTNIFPALDTAYRDLAAARARTKHAILLSDGQSPTDGIGELVQVMAAEGMTVSTVGLGPQADRALLQGIADQAGGRFHHTNDPYNIPRIFTRETSQVTRSAVVEEFFRPVVESRAELLRGLPMAAAPYLRGYVSTRMKPLPAELLLSTDVGEPLLARMPVGLGQTVAWTSDVKNRWAVDWLRWPGYATFWAQVVREVMRQRRAGVEHPMDVSIVGGQVKVTVDAHGLDDRFVNGLDSRLDVVDPRNRQSIQQVSLHQTGPGWYEATFPLDRTGTFLLRGTHRNQEGRVVAHSAATVAAPYPREYLTRENDSGLLSQASTITGGRGQVSPEEVFTTTPDEGVPYHRPLWPHLVIAAILLLLVDLVLRRIRLFDRGFRRS
jgi:uncharacterized membrane protein